jgi:hypothetical protein
MKEWWSSYIWKDKILWDDDHAGMMAKYQKTNLEEKISKAIISKNKMPKARIIWSVFYDIVVNMRWYVTWIA